MYRNSKFIRTSSGVVGRWPVIGPVKRVNRFCREKACGPKTYLARREEERVYNTPQWLSLLLCILFWSFVFEFHNCSSCTTHAFIGHVVLPFNVPMFVVSSRKKGRKQLTSIINMISFIVTRRSNSYMRSKD